jgi:hypothetical protein
MQHMTPKDLGDTINRHYNNNKMEIGNICGTHI